MAELTGADKFETLMAAWYSAFGERELTASEALKQTAGAARQNPKLGALRNAMEALFPIGRAINPRRLGLYLRKHIDTQCAGYRLAGSYDSNVKRWDWYIFKPASIEEIESELEESVQRFVTAREQKLAGKGLAQRLKQSEKDLRALELLQENRRASESKRLYKKREAANVQAIKAIDAAEKQPARKHIYLAPARGHFLFEDKTEKCCNDLRGLGFEASMGYLSASRFIVWIDGDPDLKELKRVAERFLVKINETENTPAKSKPKNSKEEIWDAEHQRWLPGDWNSIDHTSIRLLRQAFVEDHVRRPAVRSTPFINFGWDVFK